MEDIFSYNWKSSLFSPAVGSRYNVTRAEKSQQFNLWENSVYELNTTTMHPIFYKVLHFEPELDALNNRGRLSLKAETTVDITIEDSAALE